MSVYIVRRLSPVYRQMSLEDLLLTDVDETKFGFLSDSSATRTIKKDSLDYKTIKETRVKYLINVLKKFNNDNEMLQKCDRRNLYRTFFIPKKSGGLRRIDAPNNELMSALKRLKAIFEDDFGALYHTSAFAYVKGRCTIDAVKKHQINKSKWFAKYDLSNFFGSTTLDYVMSILKMIYPFNEVMNNAFGYEELRKAVELAFLDGGLPQGTPISPLITNIIMIPVDYLLFNKLRNYNNQQYVYTRYADDFIISSKYDFDAKAIERLINEALKEFNAPFLINDKKTRYGSSAGSNWNLGVMLNKDNEITVGHRTKRRFATMLFNYAKDKANGINWTLEDVQVLDGCRSYYSMVEKEAINRIVEKVSRSTNINIDAEIRRDLKEL